MSDWPTARLGEVFQFQNGRAFKKSEWRDAGLPIIRIQNLTGTSGDFNFYSGEVDEAIRVRPGDLLLAWSGSLGPHIWDGPEAVLNQHIFKVQHSDGVNRRFAFYALNSATQEMLSAAGGLAMAHITKKNLNAIEIPLPPLDEQRRIVAILDEFTEAETEMRRKQQDRIESLEALFATSLSAQLSAAVDSGADLTPCETVSLDALVAQGVIRLNRGNIISRRDLGATPGDNPVYSSARNENGEFGRYGLFMFDEESITWSIDGGGRFFYRPKHKYSVTNVGGILRIMESSVLDYRFLYYALTDAHSRIPFDWVRKAHPSVIRKVYDAIPLPPLDEQRRIVATLDEISAATSAAREMTARSLQELDSLRSSTLKSLLAA